MLPGFATASVDRLRAPLADDGHGNKVRDWGAAAVATITGCSVQPGTTAEDAVNRDAVLIAYTVYLPPTADVDAHDRIRIGGTVFDVDGEPERWLMGTSADHVKVFLRRWEG